MKTAAFRDMMQREILDVLRPLPWVHAVWEGGSAATGYLDDHSDLDLVLVVDDGMVEEAFRVFEDYLEGPYGITRSMRIPEPAWHGHSQAFYFIGNAPGLFYIDFLVEKLSSGNRLLEQDRHGKARIWLDRCGVLEQAPAHTENMPEKRARCLEALSVSMPVAVTEVRKQIARGLPVEAVSQHQRFVAGRLAGLLNLRYRPAMFDFGIRYAERAYPPEVSRRLEELLYIGSFQDLEPAFERAAEWAESLLEELGGEG